MFVKHHHWFLFTVCFALNIVQSLSSCDVGYYTAVLPNNEETCLLQQPVKASLRATPQEFLYTLTFDNSNLPFKDIDDFKRNVQITLFSTMQNISSDPILFQAQALAQDLTIIQILPDITEVPYSTVMTVNFTDYRPNQTSSSYITESPKVLLPTSGSSSSGFGDSLKDTLLNVDFIIEIVWIAISIFNPYWLFYMDCKFYRETMDLLKRINVQRSPFANAFFRADDKKVSGIRVPNLFGKFLYGSSLVSEWDKTPQNVIGFNSIPTNRIEDLKILVDNQIHRFNSFTLFVDNYGVQLTLLLGLLVVAVPLEVSLRVARRYRRKESRLTRGLSESRRILFNFLLLTFLGSYQSLSLYTGLQIQSYFSPKTAHNQLGFYLAICLFGLLTISVFTYVRRASKAIIKDFEFDMLVEVDTKAKQRQEPLLFFDSVLTFFKASSLILPMTLLLVIPKSIIFAAALIALPNYPIIQVAVMLGTNSLTMLLIIIFNPFVRRLHLTAKLIFETIILATLAILLVLAIQDKNNTFNMENRSILDAAVLILWIAVPGFCVLFGLIGLIFYFTQRPSRMLIKKSSTIVPLGGISSLPTRQFSENQKKEDNIIRRETAEPKSLKRIVPISLQDLEKGDDWKAIETEGEDVNNTNIRRAMRKQSSKMVRHTSTNQGPASLNSLMDDNVKVTEIDVDSHRSIDAKVFSNLDLQQEVTEPDQIVSKQNLDEASLLAKKPSIELNRLGALQKINEVNSAKGY